MNTCYLYKWTEIATGKWYIGSRTAKKCHPNDGYICSSKYVKPLIMANSSGWYKHILAVGTKEDILKKECFILHYLSARDDKMSYNRCNAGLSFMTAAYERTTEHYKKVSDSMKGRKFSAEHRKNLSVALKGRVMTDEWKDNIRKSRIGKKRNKDKE